LEHIGFGVGEPSARKRFFGRTDLSAMRWVSPSRPDVVVRKARILTWLRIPKHFRNMREHPGEVLHGELLCSCHTFCSVLEGSGRRGLRPHLFIRRARHCTLDRMRDYLENGFGRDQAHRPVRDAEVLVEASNDRRQNGDQEAEFHPRHSSPAKRGSDFDEKIGKGERENQIGQNEAGHDFAEYPGVSGGDLLRLLAYHTGVERPVKRYTNQPYRSCGREKPTYVHNSALSSSAEEAFPLLLAN